MKLYHGPDPQEYTNDSYKDTIILSEDSLLNLSKSLTGIIPKQESDVNDAELRRIRSLRDDLFRTASSTRLSLTHGAAALNSLCGFLELCGASTSQEVNDLSFAFTSWAEALNIFLARTEDNKAKPVRRLLLTLTSLLTRHPVNDVKLLLISHAIHVSVRAICDHNGFISVKAAIQVLEHFLIKRIVDATNITQLLQLGHDQQGEANPTVNVPNHIDIVQNFTLSVLQWAQYPDCAPAIGRFLPAFFVSLRFSQSQEVSYGVDDGDEALLPMWISPIKQSLARDPGLQEVYENHVLPGLLRMSAADRKAFLSTLPLEDIQRGNSGSHTFADIQLCLLVVRIEAKSTLPPAKTSHNQVHQLMAIEEVGFVRRRPSNVIAEDNRIKVDAERLAKNLLEHSLPAVRIAAFSILVSFPISTCLVFEIFACLRRCIPFFHIEVSAKARNEFIALTKKLCMRIRAAAVSLTRDHIASDHAHQIECLPPVETSTEKQNEHNLPKQLHDHLNFRVWYTRLLTHELRPTASYQCHITALKILEFLFEERTSLRINPTKASQQYFGLLDKSLPPSLLLRPLLDLMLDPFDDVRQVASMLIQTHFTIGQASGQPKANGAFSVGVRSSENDAGSQVARSVVCAALMTAESKAAKTGRADHADGVGRLYALHYNSGDASSVLDNVISQLEKEVELAKRELSLAVDAASLHGHLIALRYIVSRADYWVVLDSSTLRGNDFWNDYNERIMAICDGVWEAVRDVLCFDAPEGINTTDDEIDDVDIKTNDTLSYCWRALKESSSLMHSTITNSAYSPSPSGKYVNLERFGRLSLTQLGDLRHRGAFSTVSLTFAACCTACARSCSPRLIQEQKNWYQEALAHLAQNASTLTRRSAGLPAMITGILAAKPDGDFFNDVVLDLQAIADGPLPNATDSEDASLPHVHALNCLKDIFTDARFGTSTEAHMADAMDIAASCLENHIWAIQNCGLMLFKALLKRLNGGTDTASTRVSSAYRRSSSMAYEKCPNLPGLIVNLLSSSLTMRSQSVFAALEVLERSGLPPGHESRILHTLWAFTERPEWSLREKAAKVLSVVIDDQKLEEQHMRMLSPNWNSQNELHGRLLCLRFVLGRIQVPLFGGSLGTYERLLSLLEQRLVDIVVRNPCPITVAAFVDCMAELIVILTMSRSPVTLSSPYVLTDILPRVKSKQPSPLALPLQERAFARILALDVSVLKSRGQSGQDAIVGTLQKFSQRHLEAIEIMDRMQQFVSDENMLATLSNASSRDLIRGSRNMQSTGWEPMGNIRLTNDPREADYALALSGYSQGVAYAGKRFESPPAKPLREWTRMLQLAGHERSELRTRSAAVFSLRGFFEALLNNKVKPTPQANLLEVYLALHDTLLDDDEDVRNQGATTVSSLLSTVASYQSRDIDLDLSLSPPAAKCKLLDFMKAGYSTSRSMYLRAVEKLVDLQLLPSTPSEGCDYEDTVGKVRLRPVAEISLDALTPQLAVFVEEKQNLYIDAVKEAVVWAEVLLGLESNARVVEVANALEIWTEHGLLHFQDTMRQGEDYAFGPTSIPEVFALYMRVILSAQIIMAQSDVASVGDHARDYPCQKLLEELLRLGKEQNLHSVLIDHIEETLTAPQKSNGN